MDFAQRRASVHGVRADGSRPELAHQRPFVVVQFTGACGDIRKYVTGACSRQRTSEFHLTGACVAVKFGL